MKFTFDVPCYANLVVTAANEKEAHQKAADYLAAADLSHEVSAEGGFKFEMNLDTESDIDLIDEEEEGLT